MSSPSEKCVTSIDSFMFPSKFRFFLFFFTQCCRWSRTWKWMNSLQKQMKLKVRGSIYYIEILILRFNQIDKKLNRISNSISKTIFLCYLWIFWRTTQKKRSSKCVKYSRTMLNSKFVPRSMNEFVWYSGWNDTKLLRQWDFSRLSTKIFNFVCRRKRYYLINPTNTRVSINATTKSTKNALEYSFSNLIYHEKLKKKITFYVSAS